MRTQEEQVINIADARGNRREEANEAIRNSFCCEADRETMARIVNAGDAREVMDIYWGADTAVRDCLQEIIEGTQPMMARSAKGR